MQVADLVISGLTSSLHFLSLLPMPYGVAAAPEGALSIFRVATDWVTWGQLRSGQISIGVGPVVWACPSPVGICWFLVV